MNSLASLAYVYMLGLGCGIWSKKEVIDWCDKVIEVKENPPYEIIEVSLMSNEKMDAIEGKLFEFSKNAEDNHFVKILFGALYEKIKHNQLDVEQAVKCSTRLLVQTGLSYEEGYYNLYSMDDSLELAKDGVYGDLSEVADDYLNEISIFRTFFDEFQRMYLAEMNCEWVSQPF
ncbi:protein kinase [Paenibacillus chitinolyticus]|uniref:protein kinase n=1 Tax=Paenibacillus chitinolyticus TaxID=79263 RepID=UPI0036DC41D6